MGSSDSKPAQVQLTGGAAERAAAFTAPPPATDGTAGLNNFGNTCYCNAVIQALYFTRPLRERLRVLGQVIKGNLTVDALKALDETAALDHEAHLRFYVDDASDDDDAPLEHPAEGQGDEGSSPAGSPTAVRETMKPPARPPAPDLKALDDSVLGRLCDLFNAIETSSDAAKGKSKAVGPRAFVNKVKAENAMFQNTQQQDAHEFAIYVLNALIDDEKLLLSWPKTNAELRRLPRHRRASPLERLLCGKTLSRTFCAECDTETSVAQPFLDVNIDVQPNCSLRHCTELYSAYETLSGDDKFRCDACTSPVDARRRLVFKELPTVLFLQLKRFRFQERLASFTKCNDRLPFASIMTVQTVHNETARYKLAGVVVHQGATPNVGHYVALCCGAQSNQWFKCDDDTISPFLERDLQRYFGVSDAMYEPGTPSTATAYLLFFSRLPR